MEKEKSKISVCKSIVMTGVYYKHYHPGGISSVIQSWSEYFDDLQYYPTFMETNSLGKIYIFIKTLVCLFVKLLFDKHVKIVHIHTAADHDFWRSEKIVRLALLFNKKIILHSHASRFKDFYAECPDKKKQWIKDTLLSVDILIVLSESWRKWFESIGIPASKIVILHNITPFPSLKQEKPVYKSLGDKINFLFLGEIGFRKGVFDLVNTIINHRSELREKMCLHIGGNKNEQKLKSMITNGDVSDIIKFEGFICADKKIEQLNWSDVYILPSFNEGLPISILEAMSYGMPIISTPVGGIPEVVDETNGVLVTPGNEEEIYMALMKYIENPDTIVFQGNKSTEKVREYLPDKVISNLDSIYKKLIES